MSEQSFNSSQDDEISLKDIIDFLIESWKSIAVAGVLGIVGATAFLWVTPNQYQATAQIQMAQISATNNSINPLGVNIEEPNLLMARLKLPSTYSNQEIKACGLEWSRKPSENLANAAKFSAVNGVGSLIELKINRDSKEVAVACVQSIFENIKASQNQIIKPYIEEAKILLIKYQDRLSNIQSLVSRVDNKPEAPLFAVYLIHYEEVKFLTEEIQRLNTFIVTAKKRQAKLVAPIYVSDKPVSPKKKNSLIQGLLAGLFSGLLFVIARRTWRNYNLNATR